MFVIFHTVSDILHIICRYFCALYTKFHLPGLNGSWVPHYWISNFVRVVNVVFFILGDSPASEFYVPVSEHTQFYLHRSYK